MKSKCNHCKKKVGLLGIHCSHCSGKYCSGCITLEQHECSGIKMFIEKEKEKLKQNLESSMYTKKEKLLPGFEENA